MKAFISCLSAGSLLICCNWVIGYDCSYCNQVCCLYYILDGRPKLRSTCCVACGTDEMDAVRLATHYIDMHTTDILPHYNVTYPCTEANEGYPEPLQSTTSLPAFTPAYTEASVGEFQYVCGEEGCHVGYCSIVDLRLHQEETHSTVTLDRLLFRCHRCSEVLTYDDFMQHVDEGHCQTCDICHKVYKSTNSEIARHRRCREQDVKRHRTKFVLNQSGMMVPELRFDRQYGICDICGQILTESENTHRKKFHPHMHISISSQCPG